MSVVKIISKLLRGCGFFESSYVNQFPDPELAREGLDELEERGIIHRFPFGVVVAIDPDHVDDTVREMREALYQPVSDDVEIAVGGSLYEDDVTVTENGDPSEYL